MRENLKKDVMNNIYYEAGLKHSVPHHMDIFAATDAALKSGEWKQLCDHPFKGKMFQRSFIEGLAGTKPR